jgi:hypothetical protein
MLVWVTPGFILDRGVNGSQTGRDPLLAVHHHIELLIAWSIIGRRDNVDSRRPDPKISSPTSYQS